MVDTTWDGRKDEYNKFLQYPELSYNCIAYLIDHEEMLFKLLKYATPDAWNQPNLTKQEKGSMVYDGSPNETDFKIFLDTGADNSWTLETCILRVSPLSVIPTNITYGYVTMGFEVYSHYKINHLSNYQTRIDLASQRIIETMNGAEVGGLGRLYFDQRGSRATKSIVIGSIPYKGRATILCNYAV